MRYLVAVIVCLFYYSINVFAIDVDLNEFIVNGCTDIAACNYDPLADTDDGTCSYDDSDGVDSVLCPENNCPADLDDNGYVSTSDLLIFLTQFGTICE